MRALQGEACGGGGGRCFGSKIDVSDLSAHAEQLVGQAHRSRRPVLLTCEGRAVAVLESLADYERGVEERAFMRAVIGGLAGGECAGSVSLGEARARLGLA